MLSRKFQCVFQCWERVEKSTLSEFMKTKLGKISFRLLILPISYEGEVTVCEWLPIMQQRGFSNISLTLYLSLSDTLSLHIPLYLSLCVCIWNSYSFFLFQCLCLSSDYLSLFRQKCIAWLSFHFFFYFLTIFIISEINNSVLKLYRLVVAAIAP